MCMKMMMQYIKILNVCLCVYEKYYFLNVKLKEHLSLIAILRIFRKKKKKNSINNLKPSIILTWNEIITNKLETKIFDYFFFVPILL